MRTTIITLLVVAVVAGILAFNNHKSKILYAYKILTTSQHTISYNGENFQPKFVVIHLGDSVTVKNDSIKSMEIAVGRHDNHETLEGFEEKIVKPETSYTFSPREKGVFDLHDHKNPKELGALVVDE